MWRGGEIMRAWCALVVLGVQVGMNSGREFKKTDFRRPPDFSDHPYEGAFKCFTCDATDNYECNVSAPDQWCPEDTYHCKTVHSFLSDPVSREYIRSIRVEKVCASRHECHNVDRCTVDPVTGRKQCTKCCTGNICNMDVPYDARETIVLTTTQKTTIASTTSAKTTKTLPKEVVVVELEMRDEGVLVPEIVHPIVTRHSGLKSDERGHYEAHTSSSSDVRCLQNSLMLMSSLLIFVAVMF